MDVPRWGLWALVPAPFVFAARAAIEAAAGDPTGVAGLGAVTAIAGVLSLLGVALLLWRRMHAVPGGVLVVVGHFVLSPWLPDLGAGMVYLGTGLLAAPWRAHALAGGALAMVAAPLRPETLGHVGVALGALVLGWGVLAAALDMSGSE